MIHVITIVLCVEEVCLISFMPSSLTKEMLHYVKGHVELVSVCTTQRLVKKVACLLSQSPVMESGFESQSRHTFSSLSIWHMLELDFGVGVVCLFVCFFYNTPVFSPLLRQTIVSVNRFQLCKKLTAELSLRTARPNCAVGDPLTHCTVV